jgi:transmembrane sensor
MSERRDEGLADRGDRLEQAVEWFLRMRGEAARAEDLPELQRWIDTDPRNALAYQKVCAAWQTVGTHASAPEIVIGRRDALEDSRKAGHQRWSAKRIRLLDEKNGRFGRVRHWVIAASLVTAWVLGLWSLILPQTKVYTTDLGERRTLTLQDGSVITLDSRSRVRVRYTEKDRLIALEQGQAQFAVARDPLRPFRVRARDQTVVALGTQFNVELIASAVFVTLIEGHVAITGIDHLREKGDRHWGGEEDRSLPRPRTPTDPGSDEASSRSGDQAETIELTAGEALRIHQDGRAVLVPNVDLDRATAWESGKLFFDNEPLASAVERVNRYARRQIEVDPSAATVEISGVFNAGDANAFIEAVTTYFPVEADQANDTKVRLTAR